MQSRIDAQIIVPCLNEESSIPAFLEELALFRQSLASESVHFNLIFVDNGSTDKSYSLLQKHCAAHPKDTLIRCAARGYGAALKMGFENSSAEILGFTDLDCTYPLSKFSDLYKYLADNADTDMVIANRMTKQSKMPKLRTIGNRLYTSVIKVVYGIQLPDACSGMRLFRRRLLDTVLACENIGLGFSIELTCRMLLNDWIFKYVDISYNERQGTSKLNVIKDGFSFLTQIFYSKRFPYDKT